MSDQLEEMYEVRPVPGQDIVQQVDYRGRPQKSPSRLRRGSLFRSESLTHQMDTGEDEVMRMSPVRDHLRRPSSLHPDKHSKASKSWGKQSYGRGHRGRRKSKSSSVSPDRVRHDKGSRNKGTDDARSPRRDGHHKGRGKRRDADESPIGLGLKIGIGLLAIGAGYVLYKRFDTDATGSALKLIQKDIHVMGISFLNAGNSVAQLAFDVAAVVPRMFQL